MEAIYYKRGNKYYLVKDGRIFILKAYMIKSEATVFAVGHKILINASQNRTLMVMRGQEVEKSLV